MPVDVGVIQQFFHPPLGLLIPNLVHAGPFSGNVTLTTFDAVPVGNTYGAVVAVNGAIPANLGHLIGWSHLSDLFSGETYYDRLFQVVIQHQLLGGAWVNTQVVDSYQVATLVLWETALPGRVGIYTLPGIAVDVLALLV